ncbi:alpha/beta hydrolase [Streptomyces sp. JH14]|uniref:esterase/lipase family protein n=1 Tax=Streptomyces sp. JH14 TaxID=2793630 RepID=UPI0023F98914|nr:alpha/beta fold hydrolase [Streptomyces sp. JH14]MDF6046089.1 alpha/beta hydrolase [Streptomyces sp. JH14]
MLTATVLAAAAGTAAADIGTKPTAVLVQGAFADASGWDGVTERLQHDGYGVLAPADPLRALARDSLYIAGVLKSIQGPIVLVGHSYAGAVIRTAAAENPQVKSLVYVSPLTPDKGPAPGVLSDRLPGGGPGPALRAGPLLNNGGTGVSDLYVQTAKSHATLASNLPGASSAVTSAGSRVAPVPNAVAITALIRQAAADASPAQPAMAATGRVGTLALVGLGGLAGVTVLTGCGLIGAARKRREPTR